MKKKKMIVLGVIALSLAICIVTGLLLSGSGNGYEKTLAALEGFLFRTDNCTMLMNAEIRIDGESYAYISETIQYDRGNQHAWDTTQQGEILENSESFKLDGMYYYDIDHENKGYLAQKLSGNSAPDSVYLLPEEGQSVWRFARLFTDFMAGNAKNRFVRERLADGNRYTLSLSADQLPEAVLLINDIFNESVGHTVPEGIVVDFENEQGAFVAYHLNTYAHALDEDFFDFCHSNALLSAAYEDEKRNMMKRYESLALGDNSYIRVAADGTAQVYASPAEYYASIPLTRENLSEYSPMIFIEEMTFERIELVTQVDEEGNLVGMSIVGVVGFNDFGGGRHTAEFFASLNVSSIGQTEIMRFPPEGYTEMQKPSMTYVSEEITKDVRFAGTEYTVTYTKWVKE